MNVLPPLIEDNGEVATLERILGHSCSSLAAGPARLRRARRVWDQDAIAGSVLVCGGRDDRPGVAPLADPRGRDHGVPGPARRRPHHHRGGRAAARRRPGVRPGGGPCARTRGSRLRQPGRVADRRPADRPGRPAAPLRHLRQRARLLRVRLRRRLARRGAADHAAGEPDRLSRGVHRDRGRQGRERRRQRLCRRLPEQPADLLRGHRLPGKGAPERGHLADDRRREPAGHRRQGPALAQGDGRAPPGRARRRTG